MQIQALGKLIIVAGLVLAASGALLLLAARIPLIGRLPGDFLVKWENFTFYFSLVTMLLLSLVLTIVVNLALRIFRG